MDFKVIHGGLDRDKVELIESLMTLSKTNLISSNLGSKVTKVSVKRILKDTYVSVVFLKSSDYTNITTSLQDDRLVCVSSDSDIEEFFNQKFNVTLEVEVEPEPLENEIDDFPDEGEDETYSDFNETDTDIEDVDELESSKEMSWEELMNNFDKIGSDTDTDSSVNILEEEDSDEEQEDSSLSEKLNSNENPQLDVSELELEIEEEVEEEIIRNLRNTGVLTVDATPDKDELLRIPPEDYSLSSSNSEDAKVGALESLIEKLRQQLNEQEEFLSKSVNIEDYNKLKTELETANEDLGNQKDINKFLRSNLNDKVEETDSLKRTIKTNLRDSEQTITSLRLELEDKVKAKETVDGELSELKIKFKELMGHYMKKEDEIKRLKKNQTVSKPKVTSIKKRYPNVEFIVPCSSNSVIPMYEELSKRTESLLFIDLTNNTYIDNFIRFEKVTNPMMWLSGERDYKKVASKSVKHKNIRIISSVVHKLEDDYLLKIDWDKILGELTKERKVVINIGSIYDADVRTVLKAIQRGVSIKAFIRDSKRDERIAKFALEGLTEYKLIENNK